MKPYFIWDYDLDENQIRAILRGDNETEKLWLMTRIMTHAKFEDIWKYVSIKEIVKAFPKLRLQPLIPLPYAPQCRKLLIKQPLP